MKEEKWEQLELMSISSAESEDLPSHVCGSESKPSHSVKSKNTHKESSEKTSQEHGYSRTFGHFQQMNFSSLGCLPEDTLANLFQMPDSEEARRTTVTSGLRCSELFKRADLIGCLQKMLLVTSQWASTKCYLIWKEKTTPANRLLFQLVPKMPTTDVTESGLWLGTPKATQSIRSEKFRKGRTPTPEEFVMWATPRATDYKAAGAGTNDQSIVKRMKEGTKNLSEHVQATERKLWPTTLADDAKNVNPKPNRIPGLTAKVKEMEKMFPTPNAWDAERGPLSKEKMDSGKHQITLVTAVKHMANSSGSLNPTWVEWLMGYPIGWTDCADSETPSSLKSHTKSSKQ
jgi:DNA (cytosine-5)-methyltransferase 1